MQIIHPALRLPLIFGFVMVLPLFIMELINRDGFNEDFPFLLFEFLGALPAAFFLIAAALVQNVRKPFSRKFTFVNVAGWASLIFILWLWLHVVWDQLPCFLGGINCD
jgi:hypothetical protein